MFFFGSSKIEQVKGGLISEGFSLQIIFVDSAQDSDLATFFETFEIK